MLSWELRRACQCVQLDPELENFWWFFNLAFLFSLTFEWEWLEFGVSEECIMNCGKQGFCKKSRRVSGFWWFLFWLAYLEHCKGFFFFFFLLVDCSDFYVAREWLALPSLPLFSLFLIHDLAKDFNQVALNCFDWGPWYFWFSLDLFWCIPLSSRQFIYI